MAGSTESDALAKLKAAAGLVVEKPVLERLDWMYDQSATRPTDEQLMNMPVAAEKDKDIQDVKKLEESTAGSLFLKSATKTTEDVLRKLREDPLFQIKRQEQLARESMLANPLVQARLQKKAEKIAQKKRKKEKKAVRKLKKAAKKVKKAQTKAAAAAASHRKHSSTSSSDSDSSDSSSSSSTEDAPVQRSRSPIKAEPRSGPVKSRSRSRGLSSQSTPRRLPSEETPSCSPRRRTCRTRPREETRPREVRRPRDEKASLGPSSQIVSKREEYAETLRVRKEQALASRGAPRRMDDEEKHRRLKEMQMDAARHEQWKDQKIAVADLRDKQIEEREAKMRDGSDQKYLRDVRQEAYLDSGASMADRVKNQRHRRQRHINDPLERGD